MSLNLILLSLLLSFKILLTYLRGPNLPIRCMILLNHLFKPSIIAVICNLVTIDCKYKCFYTLCKNTKLKVVNMYTQIVSTKV